MEMYHNFPGVDKLKALKLHYLLMGLNSRQHGNHNRLPANTLSIVDTRNVVRFLQNYAENHAILLPGRIPGYKRDDLQLLPSSTTKKVSIINCRLLECYLPSSKIEILNSKPQLTSHLLLQVNRPPPVNRPSLTPTSLNRPPPFNGQQIIVSLTPTSLNRPPPFNGQQIIGHLPLPVNLPSLEVYLSKQPPLHLRQLTFPL